MALQLKYRETTDVPVEVEGLTPDRVADMSLPELERMPVFVGT